MIGKTKIAIAPNTSLDKYSSNASNQPILPKESHHDLGRIKALLKKDGKEALDTDKKNDRIQERSPSSKNKSFNTGRWSRAEKRLFLEGLRRHGKGRWKQIGKVVKTRSLIQIKSHAQKVLKKLEAGEDVFAVLDDYLDCSDDEGQPKCASPRKDAEDSANKNDGTSNVTNYVRGNASSKFAWILPAMPMPMMSTNATNDSIKDTERKRKGRKRETKGRTMYKRFRGLSSVADGIGGEECEDNGTDTTVAVQALSTLFLSPPPPVKTDSVCTDGNDAPVHVGAPAHLHSEETLDRMEDARILLSLMDHGKSWFGKANNDTSTTDNGKSWLGKAKNDSTTSEQGKSWFGKANNEASTTDNGKSWFGKANNETTATDNGKSWFGKANNETVTTDHGKSWFGKANNETTTADHGKSWFGKSNNDAITTDHGKSWFGKTNNETTTAPRSPTSYFWKSS